MSVSASSTYFHITLPLEHDLFVDTKEIVFPACAVKLSCKELNKQDDQWTGMMVQSEVWMSGFGMGQSQRDLASTYVLHCLASSSP